METCIFSLFFFSNSAATNIFDKILRKIFLNFDFYIFLNVYPSTVIIVYTIKSQKLALIIFLTNKIDAAEFVLSRRPRVMNSGKGQSR